MPACGRKPGLLPAAGHYWLLKQGRGQHLRPARLELKQKELESRQPVRNNEVIIMNTRTVFPLFILLLLPSAHSSAEQAYTWIDKSGTTHFSESPPYDETISAEQINLLPAPSAGNISGDDFYSVVKQANRMEKKRLENEKLIAKRLQAEAELRKASAAAAQQTPYQQNTQGQTRYYPAYPYYPNPGYRPGHGYRPHPGRPGHPVHLPAYKPRTSLGR